MECETQHEVVWTLIKKGRDITKDLVIAVYQDHQAIRERLTQLNERFPGQYTISTLAYYPSK